MHASRFAFVALALLVIAPAAAELTLSADAIEGRIRPEGAPVKLNVQATVDCESATAFAPAAAYATDAITMSFTSPDGVMVTGPASIILDKNPCITDPMGDASGDADFYISASRDVPGLETLNATITGAMAARVVGPQVVAEAQTGSLAVPFVVDFYPLIAARVGSKIVEGPPQTPLFFPVTIENKGNAPTQIRFDLGQPIPEGWNVRLPDVTDVRPTAKNATLTTVLVEVDTPFEEGFNNEEQAFQVVLTTSATMDPSLQGNTLSVSILARVRGCYDAAKGPVPCEGQEPQGDANASPGIAAPLAVLVLAGAAFRRRTA